MANLAKAKVGSDRNRTFLLILIPVLILFVAFNTFPLLTGVFACAEVNGVDGLLYGNPHQLWVQLVSVIATVGFCFPVSFALLKLTDKLVGLRVPLEKEVTGLDISEHSESGYQI